jgi:hypothetical protein
MFQDEYIAPAEGRIVTLPLDLMLLESERKFQQFCFRLALKEFPDAIPVAFASWDGGRDILALDSEKGDIVWQCKFTRSLNRIKPKIVESLKALDPGRKISNWVLCLPVDASGIFLDWLRTVISDFPFIGSWEVWGREALLERLGRHRDVLEVFFYPVWKALESRFRTDELELVRYDIAARCGWKSVDSKTLCFAQRKGSNSDLVLDIIVRSRGAVQSLLHSIRLNTADVRRHLRGLPGTGLLWPQRTYTISLKGGSTGTHEEQMEPPLIVDCGAHQRFKLKLAATGYAWTGYIRLTLLYGDNRELFLPWTFLKA